MVLGTTVAPESVFKLQFVLIEAASEIPGGLEGRSKSGRLLIEIQDGLTILVGFPEPLKTSSICAKVSLKRVLPGEGADSKVNPEKQSSPFSLRTTQKRSFN